MQIKLFSFLMLFGEGGGTLHIGYLLVITFVVGCFSSIKTSSVVTRKCCKITLQIPLKKIILCTCVTCIAKHTVK